VVKIHYCSRFFIKRRNTCLFAFEYKLLSKLIICYLKRNRWLLCCLVSKWVHSFGGALLYGGPKIWWWHITTPMHYWFILLWEHLLSLFEKPLEFMMHFFSHPFFSGPPLPLHSSNQEKRKEQWSTINNISTIHHAIYSPFTTQMRLP